MPYLNWIEDQQLIDAVLHLLDIAKKSQREAEAKFNKNVIDPFSAFFQIVGFGIDFNNWVINEKTRQSQKTLQNHIGNFHQNILGNVKGWVNLNTGNVMDLLSVKYKIIAEIKNKHNTIKGSDLSGLYSSMENAIMSKHSKYKGYTAYYVTIVPQAPKRFNKVFTPSDKEKGSKLSLNEKIRIIDGASFYHLVTGEEHALKQLFTILPYVVEHLNKKRLSDNETKNLHDFFSLAYGSSTLSE